MESTFNISAVLLGAIVGIAATLITQTILKGFALTYGREVQNWNALVKLEFLLNTNLQMNDDNATLLAKILEAIEKGTLPIFQLRPCEIDDSMMSEVKNIDLKNDLFALNVELKRINHMISVASTTFYDLRKYRVLNQLSQQDLVNAYAATRNDAEKLKEYIKFLDIELQNHLAKIRVLCKSKGFLRSALKVFARKERYPKNFDSKVEKEMALLKEEFKIVSEKRKQKINAIDAKGN